MRRLFHTILAFGPLFLATILSAAAQSPIVRIEEDWELKVLQPDFALDAPQVSTMMLPGGETSDLYFQLHLNHAPAPVFSQGGMQLRMSDDDTTICHLRTFAGQRFQTPNELVSWTQVAQRAPTGIFFGIVSGQSSSWGAFGGENDFLYISYLEAGLSSLANYKPQDSIDNSGVNYASNRVSWLKLTKVRIYYESGEETELSLNVQVK